VKNVYHHISYSCGLIPEQAGFERLAPFISVPLGLTCDFLLVVALSDLSYGFYEGPFMTLKDK